MSPSDLTQLVRPARPSATYNGTVTAPRNASLPPLLAALVALALWIVVAERSPAFALPGPMAVGQAFLGELRNGRLLTDIVASLGRIGAGFGLACAVGIPAGVWLGHTPLARAAILPAVNFLRALSPLAWIPFAILWFGIGSAPAVFLIFMATVFPLMLATSAAVAAIPGVYFRVARDLGLAGPALWCRVTLPAILPEVLTAVRVAAGLAWMVVVAAEMIAGPDGLGFAIWDARNGLRTDLLVVGMLVIGAIGLTLDRLLASFARLPGVRWAYER